MFKNLAIRWSKKQGEGITTEGLRKTSEPLAECIEGISLQKAISKNKWQLPSLQMRKQQNLKEQSQEIQFSGKFLVCICM